MQIYFISVQICYSKNELFNTAIIVLLCIRLHFWERGSLHYECATCRYNLISEGTVMLLTTIRKTYRCSLVLCIWICYVFTFIITLYTRKEYSKIGTVIFINIVYDLKCLLKSSLMFCLESCFLIHVSFQ